MKVDSKLTFLYKASNKELVKLCDIVTKERDGSFRVTETLSDTRKYQRNFPDRIKAFLPELIHEFRLFGGNYIINFFRGEGPKYSDILWDVAEKCDVQFNSSFLEVEHVEQLLLSKLLRDALEAASNEELAGIMSELHQNQHMFSRHRAISKLEKLWKIRNKEGLALMGGITSNVVSQLTGLTSIQRGMSMGLSRLIPMIMGPVGVLLSAIYGVIGMSGPAYRVTIPGVIYIAYLRQKITVARKRSGISSFGDPLIRRESGCLD